MSMNFKFSHGYGQSRAVPSIGSCCYGNTNSPELVLEKQWATVPSMGRMPDDTGGL
jgi:hypothetical protein